VSSVRIGGGKYSLQGTSVRHQLLYSMITYYFAIGVSLPPSERAREINVIISNPCDAELGPVSYSSLVATSVARYVTPKTFGILLASSFLGSNWRHILRVC
jgi:hypothetical protein